MLYNHVCYKKMTISRRAATNIGRRTAAGWDINAMTENRQ